MSYRIATLSALQASLAAAGTTVTQCRANISRLPMSGEERDGTVARIRKQIGDLEAMILELTRPDPRKRCSQILSARSRRLPKKHPANP